MLEEQSPDFPVSFISSLGRGENTSVLLALLSSRHYGEVGSPDVHNMQKITPGWRLSKVGFIRIPHSAALSIFKFFQITESVPPSVALLQHKGAGPSWTLKGTGIIWSLLKNSCVGVAHLALTKHRRARFCFAEGGSN